MLNKNILQIIQEIDTHYKKLYSEIQSDIKVIVKENGTSVSQFDLDATDFCIKIIQKFYPQANIWIEEDDTILKCDKEELTFIIDPLDGTASFLRGYPVWGIGVGVLLDNMPLLSYFYAPACNQKYLAYDEKVFINDTELSTQTNVLNADTKTLFISSRLHKKIDFTTLQEYKIRNFGSTLYHLFMVVLAKAESTLIGSCYIWDLAAVFFLAQKNGYYFVDFTSKEIVTFEELLAYKSAKIDTILEFKKGI